MTVHSSDGVYAKGINSNLAFILVFFSSLFFSASLIPDVSGLKFLADYGWRLSSFLFILVMLIERRGAHSNYAYLLLNAPYLVLIFIPAFFENGIGADELTKNLVLVAVVFMISPDVNDGRFISSFDYFLKFTLAISGVFSLIVLSDYISGGWGWQYIRYLKAELLQKLPINAILFFFSISIILIRTKREFYRIVLIMVFLGSSVMLATRTPAMALGLAVIVSGLCWKVRSKARIPDVFSAGVIPGVLIAVTLFLESSASADINRILAGRQSLWIAGLEMWRSAPLMGDLTTPLADAVGRAYSLMSFRFDWEVSALMEISSGGFHNIWIQALATRGILGLLTIWFSYALLIYRSLASGDFRYFILVIFISIRGLFEIGGMPFSLASAPMDFISYVIVGMITSLEVKSVSRDSDGRISS